MKYSIKSFACIVTVLLSTIAQAEIYEEQDAQGNTVYTDSPDPGATEVDLPETNTADAVKPTAAETPAMGEAPKPAGTQQEGGNVVVIPNSRNEELERVINADRPHEVLEAEPRYEVGDHVTAEERARREAAKEGVMVDEQGNVEHIEHRGHVGGHR
jgi:hypothetical protein